MLIVWNKLLTSLFVTALRRVISFFLSFFLLMMCPFQTLVHVHAAVFFGRLAGMLNNREKETTTTTVY